MFSYLQINYAQTPIGDPHTYHSCNFEFRPRSYTTPNNEKIYFNFYYQYEGESTWTKIPDEGQTLVIGETPEYGPSYVRIKGLGNGTADLKPDTSFPIAESGATGYFSLSGDLESLIEGEGSTVSLANIKVPRGAYTILFYTDRSLTNIDQLTMPSILSEYCCYRAFYNCWNLTSAKVSLPATTLFDHCYAGMFEGCSALIDGPTSFSATALEVSSCEDMFKSCSKLETVFENGFTVTSVKQKSCYRMFYSTIISTLSNFHLSASTLAINCYEQMFAYDVRLTSIPSNFLPATTLAYDCYNKMFYHCTGFTTILSNLLPATSVTQNCYASMFEGCTNLTTLPSLPATNSDYGCYQYMFKGTHISSIPSNYLPVTAIGQVCYKGMFENCTSLTAIPSNLLPATTLQSNCYRSMFAGCTSLTAIPVDIWPTPTRMASECYQDMFKGCTGLTTLPSGLLPAKTQWDFLFATNCYVGMFEGCTGLISVPSDLLPSTMCVQSLYSRMFYGCTSLQNCPDINLERIDAWACNQMFYGCTSLRTVPVSLPANKVSDDSSISSNGCYQMFYNCSNITTLPELHFKNISGSGLYQMFYGCSKIKLSETPSDEYNVPCRIGFALQNGQGDSAVSGMFTRTGGTFTGTPQTNKVYYLAGPKQLTIKGTDNRPNGTGGDLTVSFTVPSNTTYYTSTNDNSTWTALTAGTTTTKSIGPRQELYIKGTGNSNKSEIIKIGFSTTTNNTAIVKGTLKFLVESDDNASATFGNSCFKRIFKDCTNLEYAPLLFPNTTKESMYEEMFYGCSKLKSLPYVLTLPATSLATNCYNQMFINCTSLTTLPTLSATSLAYGCYSFMFSGCTNITTIPANYLPIMALAEGCYMHMFSGTGITEVPSGLLPATYLANSCYDGMFYTCPNLTTVPVNLLPATSAPAECYNQMFYGCSKLVNAPNLPATSLQAYCYSFMFYGCEKLEEVPALPATTLASGCYDRMFVGCTSLTTPAILPATNLPNNCYRSMFASCSNIKLSNTKRSDYSIPYRIPSELNSVSVGSNPTYGMFDITGGVWTGTPTVDTVYYLYGKSPTPISGYNLYIGVNGKSKKVEKIYIGVKGKAKEVTAVYVGVNGKAKQV